jgi:hypothetical protein
MRPWDAPALLRPPFDPAMFTPTKWDSAADKAVFANALARFIASDFKLALFTEKLYARLHNCFGHIAHYNKAGFIAEFFETTPGKIDFLEQTVRHPCYGDPAFTYSDAETLFVLRLQDSGILPFYRALLAAEIEAQERRLLAALSAKHDAASAPSAPSAPTASVASVPATPRHMPRGFLTPPPAPSAAPGRRATPADVRQPSLL